jgi:hypothetical protein
VQELMPKLTVINVPFDPESKLWILLFRGLQDFAVLHVHCLKSILEFEIMGITALDKNIA